MTGHGRRELTHEDRILWGRVAATAAPLKGRSAVRFPAIGGKIAEEERISAPERPVHATLVRPAAAEHRPARAFDETTRRKLSKGRLPLEAKVDLHGLSQNEAHGLLLSFLHRAYSDGRRHVLVVTGKGASFGSDGVLRRAVPAWLAAPPFRALISGYDSAARRHGGAGALYVRLRRRSGVTEGR